MKLYKLKIKKELIYFKYMGDLERYMINKYTLYPFVTPYKYSVDHITPSEAEMKIYVRQNRNNSIDNLI